MSDSKHSDFVVSRFGPWLGVRGNHLQARRNSLELDAAIEPRHKVTPAAIGALEEAGGAIGAVERALDAGRDEGDLAWVFRLGCCMPTASVDHGMRTAPCLASTEVAQAEAVYVWVGQHSPSEPSIHDGLDDMADRLDDGNLNRRSENKQSLKIASESNINLNYPPFDVIELVCSLDNNAITKWVWRRQGAEAHFLSEGLGILRHFMATGHAHTVLKSEGGRMAAEIKGVHWVGVQLLNLKRSIGKDFKALKKQKVRTPLSDRRRILTQPLHSPSPEMLPRPLTHWSFACTRLSRCVRPSIFLMRISAI